MLLILAELKFQYNPAGCVRSFFFKVGSLSNSSMEFANKSLFNHAEKLLTNEVLPAVVKEAKLKILDYKIYIYIKVIGKVFSWKI